MLFSFYIKCFWDGFVFREKGTPQCLLYHQNIYHHRQGRTMEKQMAAIGQPHPHTPSLPHQMVTQHRIMDKRKKASLKNY